MSGACNKSESEQPMDAHSFKFEYGSLATITINWKAFYTDGWAKNCLNKPIYVSLDNRRDNQIMTVWGSAKDIFSFFEGFGGHTKISFVSIVPLSKEEIEDLPPQMRTVSADARTAENKRKPWPGAAVLFASFWLSAVFSRLTHLPMCLFLPFVVYFMFQYNKTGKAPSMKKAVVYVTKKGLEVYDEVTKEEPADPVPAEIPFKSESQKQENPYPCPAYVR